MSDAASKFDSWLADNGPAALVIREHLMPVEGRDGVLFPATYAAAEEKFRFAGGYNIDVFPEDRDVGPVVAAMLKEGRLNPTIDLFPSSRNVCQVDSVGSQANRMEPIVVKAEYAELVPQVIVKAGDRSISLLEAGHRAGDAIVRCSALQAELRKAFQAVLKGNVEPLARIAPTSLVFGVWDSRDTQAKLPRLVVSTIRAYNVRRLTRSANYLVQMQLDSIKEGLLPEPKTKAEKDKYSERGHLNALTSATPGGVIAEDGVRRDSTLSLAALRLLAVREANGSLSTNRTQALRRYILGLALVAISAPQSPYLRQGCNLVPDPDRPREFTLVHAEGRREDLSLIHLDALVYARAAASAFGVGESRTVEFDLKLAERDVQGESAKDETVKGKVSEVESATRKFTLKKGTSKVTVTTSESTTYFKGEAEATFAAVVTEKADVEVELVDGVAVKVTGKTN